MRDDESWKPVVALIMSASLGVAAIISSFAWPIGWYHYQMNSTAMKYGYEQKPIPGRTGSEFYWVKVGTVKE